MPALKNFLKSFHFLTITLFVCLCLLFFTYLPEPGGGSTLRSAKASIAPPSAATPADQLPEDFSDIAREGYTEFHGTIRPGDTLSRSFSAHGVPSEVREEFIRVFKAHLDFNNLRPGEQYSVILDTDGQIVKTVYRRDPLTSYTAIPTADGLRAVRDEVQLEQRTVFLSGKIATSLFAAFPAALKNPKPVHAFADIFAAKMDFNTETKEGDLFSIIIDEYYRFDEFIGYGPILAARYEKESGEVLSAYRFAPDGKRFSYYDDDGQELGASFIRSPVAVGRVSSRFSQRRLHPILGVVKQHLGVDLAAPAGTPVLAAADGRVHSLGTNGGFGKQIVLVHSSDYRTYYGHLSKFMPGLKVGSRVRQKQTIGFVGSTGLATGPHLDYRLQHHGVYKNPFALKFQPRSTLAGTDLSALNRLIAALEPNLFTARANNTPIKVKPLIIAEDRQLALL